MTWDPVIDNIFVIVGALVGSDISSRLVVLVDDATIQTRLVYHPDSEPSDHSSVVLTIQ